MQVLVCTVETAPCPLESQAWMQIDAALSPAELGFTAESVGFVFFWGAGAMLALWLLAYPAKIAIDVIKRI